ncbi:MAG: hypothetical protein H6R10_2803 [Rhodocyclaceae bacterium]|nr:hypothetical protein [Rhodocyclaceae bacterium]
MSTQKKAKRSTGQASQRPMIDEVFSLAKQLGWVNLNDKERELIETLRWTSYQGRAVVMEVAAGMRKLHPWVRGSTSNTAVSPDLAEGWNDGQLRQQAVVGGCES